MGPSSAVSPPRVHEFSGGYRNDSPPTPREFTPLLSHQHNTATMARAPQCTEKLEVASCLSSSTSCLGQEKEREAGSISGRVSSHFPATLNFPGGSSNSRGRDFTLGLRRVLPARGAEARWPPTAGTPRPCPPPTPQGRVGRVPARRPREPVSRGARVCQPGARLGPEALRF